MLLLLGSPVTGLRIVANDSTGFADGNTGHVYTFPAGAPLVGDWDVLCVNSDTLVATPAGFTVSSSHVQSQGAYLFTRLATGSEASTVTITTSGDYNTQVTSVRIREANTVIEVATEAHVEDVGNTSTPTATTGALAVAGDLVLAFAALHSSPGLAPTAPVWSSDYAALQANTQGSGTSSATGYTAYKHDATTMAEAPSVSWTNAVQHRYLFLAAFAPIPASVIHTRSATDDAGLSDSDSLTAAYAIVDALGCTDEITITLAGNVHIDVTDPAAPSDTLAHSLTRVLVDTAALGDTALVVNSAAHAHLDTEGLTDTAWLRQTTRAIDPLNATDAVTITATRRTVRTDTAGLRDTASVGLSAIRTPTDTALQGDTVTLHHTKPSSDPLDLADSTALRHHHSLGDVLAVTDTAGRNLTRVSTDNEGITDQASRILVYPHLDELGVTDAVKVRRRPLLGWGLPADIITTPKPVSITVTPAPEHLTVTPTTPRLTVMARG